MWLITSTVLAIAAVFLATFASTIGSQTDIGTDNGLAEFLSAVGGLTGIASAGLYVLGLVGLVDGIKSLKARAQSRANYWKLSQINDDT